MRSIPGSHTHHHGSRRWTQMNADFSSELQTVNGENQHTVTLLFSLRSFPGLIGVYRRLSAAKFHL